MSTPSLGIMVTERALHGVLVESTDDGPVVRRQLSRTLGEPDDGMSDFGAMEDSMGEFDDEDDDVTIQFDDDGGGGSEMFLGSEFDDLDEGGTSPDSFDVKTFEHELSEMLRACEVGDAQRPDVAFCATGEDLDEIELRLPPDAGSQGSEGPTGLPLPAKRKRLYDMVEEQYGGNADPERVAFVPMQPADDGQHRVLAIIAHRAGPILTTLREIRDASAVETPNVRLLDAEIPVYLGMARSALQVPPDTDEKTLIVRTGDDDTLVLFMEGNTLQQAATLPSLTYRDPADTICSRVLLLQDEYGIGAVHHVLVVGEDGDDALVRGLKDYFPDAQVHGLRDFFAGGDDSTTGGYVAATGVALRALGDDDSFLDVHLVPKSYTRSSFSIPVGWSVPLLLAVLFVTSLGFVWYYLHNRNDIQERRTQLERLEQEVQQVDQGDLQTQIDSLNRMAQTYSEGMTVIDTLLKGSNKWSRGLAQVAGQTDSIEGLWVEVWNQQSETEVMVAGYATARTRVVRFADALDGEIMSLSFTEIRDWPVYSYELVVPLDTSIPEAARYWRQERLAALEAAGSESTGAATATAAPAESSGTPPRSMTASKAPAASNGTAPNPTDTTAVAADRWTLVIDAPREEDAAQSTATTYREALDADAYPIRVLQSPTNGRYLVSVGTYATLDAAKATLERMKARLPNGTWIYEIPSGSTSTASSTS
jgi:hypothetical protein